MHRENGSRIKPLLKAFLEADEPRLIGALGSVDPFLFGKVEVIVGAGFHLPPPLSHDVHR